MKIARLKPNGELILKGELIEDDTIRLGENFTVLELIESAEENKTHFLSFDGVDDTISSVGVNGFNWNEGTWEFWARARTDFANLPTNYYESLFGVEQLSPNFRLRVYARGSASFFFTFIGRGGDVRFPISRLTKDEWHHIAITYSAINGQMESYIDGVRASTSSFAYSDVALNSSFSIGKTMQYNNFNGDMKEFRVWNKPLTKEEIEYNMNNTLTGNEADLALYFPMTGIEENILTDKSSNSNDGVINGATFGEEIIIRDNKVSITSDGKLYVTELIEGGV